MCATSTEDQQHN